MKAAKKRSTTKSTNPKTSAQHTPSTVELENADYAIRKALGIALLLSETHGDEHNANAAHAIVDQLFEAVRQLGGEEVSLG